MILGKSSFVFLLSLSLLLKELLENPSSLTSSSIFQPSWGKQVSQGPATEFLLCFRPKDVDPTDLGMKVKVKLTRVMTAIKDSEGCRIFVRNV